MFKKKVFGGKMSTPATTHIPTPIPATAPAPQQPVKPVIPTHLVTTMMPGCCGLKIVRTLTCLGKTDALSVQNAETFDKQVNTGLANEGNWNTYGKAPETIAIITTSPRYHYNDPEQAEFKRQVKFLTEKGWHELCSWKSMESGGTNYMWGSKGISLSGTEKKEEEKK